MPAMSGRGRAGSRRTAAPCMRQRHVSRTAAQARRCLRPTRNPWAALLAPDAKRSTDMVPVRPARRCVAVASNSRAAWSRRGAKPICVPGGCIACAKVVGAGTVPSRSIVIIDRAESGRAEASPDFDWPRCCKTDGIEPRLLTSRRARRHRARDPITRPLNVGRRTRDRAKPPQLCALNNSINSIRYEPGDTHLVLTSLQ